jgi:hypothetical protein
MSSTLLQVMEELLQAIEQRDSGDPDAPAWEAVARIRRLEEELARRLGAGETAGDIASGGPQGRWPDEVLAGIA